MANSINNKDMNIENLPNRKSTRRDADNWLNGLDPFDAAAFQYSVTDHEKQLAEKRVNGHPLPTSSANKFEDHAGKAVEEEAIRDLQPSISQRQVEPAGGPQQDLSPEPSSS